MKIKSILSQGAFWQINKSLAQKVGLEAALLLSDLIDRESYFDSRDMLISINGEGYFFVTGEQLEESTTLSYHKQRKCLKKLKDAGMIKTFLRGVPAKTHYKIVENKIWSYLKTSSEEIKEPVVKEFKNLLLKNSKTINNNRIIIIDNNNKEQQKAKAYFDDLDINNLFIEFLDLRKSLKAKNTDRAISLVLKKLEGLSKETQIEMLEQSIENSWKSVFPIKKQFNNEKPSLAKKYFPEMFEVKGDPFETNLKLE
mgnify:FL=1